MCSAQHKWDMLDGLKLDVSVFVCRWPTSYTFHYLYIAELCVCKYNGFTADLVRWVQEILPEKRSGGKVGVDFGCEHAGSILCGLL